MGNENETDPDLRQAIRELRQSLARISGELDTVSSRVDRVTRALDGDGDSAGAAPVVGPWEPAGAISARPTRTPVAGIPAATTPPPAPSVGTPRCLRSPARSPRSRRR